MLHRTKKLLCLVVHAEPSLLTELSRLPFTIYHTLHDLIFMAFTCLEFKCHIFCTRNYSNSNQTKFKIIPPCHRTYFHQYDHIKATRQDTVNPLEWARSTTPVIYVTTSNALRTQEWPKGRRKVPIVSFSKWCLLCFVCWLTCWSFDGKETFTFI